MRSIRCGGFLAQQVRPHEWQFTCEALPDWSYIIVASLRDAMTVLFKLQEENRGWVHDVTVEVTA